MAYRQDGYQGNAKWVGIVVGLLMLGWCVAPRLGDRGTQGPVVTERSVADQITADPRSGEAFRAMRTAYPNEFSEYVRQIVGGRDLKLDAAQMATQNARFIAEALGRNRSALHYAPRDALAAMVGAESVMLDAMAASSVTACANYAAKGEVTNGLSDAIDRSIAHATALRWTAMAAGRDTPVGKSAAPAPADRTALVAAMRADGIAADDLATLQAGGLPLAPAASQCTILRHMLHGLVALPPARADGLIREIVVPL